MRQSATKIIDLLFFRTKLWHGMLGDRIRPKKKENKGVFKVVVPYLANQLRPNLFFSFH